MQPEQSHPPLKIACDAMCGGVARWLRVLGVDASYTPGIEDGDLVQHALAEQRVVLSSDGKLFERRAFTTGELRGLRLPVGLKLQEQLRFVVRELDLVPAFPRCTLCNGALEDVSRAEVGDIVPARSLIWATEFYRCCACGHVFWEGTIGAASGRCGSDYSHNGVNRPRHQALRNPLRQRRLRSSDPLKFGTRAIIL